MKILQSSFFRALCAIIVGALLIKYREQTVTWMTIAIGILFFLSGVISCATYFVARRRKDAPQVFDANGQQISGFKPTFPIVGLGSLILGIILALMPTTFINWLIYILASILILGAVSQFVNLAAVSRYARVGFYYWIMPSLILLIGLVAIIHPSTIASAPLFVIGWCMVVYGVVEMINALKISRIHRITAKAAANAAQENSGESEAAQIESDEEK